MSDDDGRAGCYNWDLKMADHESNSTVGAPEKREANSKTCTAKTKEKVEDRNGEFIPGKKLFSEKTPPPCFPPVFNQPAPSLLKSGFSIQMPPGLQGPTGAFNVPVGPPGHFTLSQVRTLDGILDADNAGKGEREDQSQDVEMRGEGKAEQKKTEDMSSPESDRTTYFLRSRFLPSVRKSEIMACIIGTL